MQEWTNRVITLKICNSPSFFTRKTSDTMSYSVLNVSAQEKGVQQQFRGEEDYLRCKETWPEQKDLQALCLFNFSKSYKKLFNKLHVFKEPVANKSTIICFLSLQGIETKQTNSSFLYKEKFQFEFFNSETYKALGRFLLRHSFVLMVWPQLDQYLWCRSQCILLKANPHKFHTPKDWKWDLVGKLSSSELQTGSFSSLAIPLSFSTKSQCGLLHLGFACGISLSPSCCLNYSKKVVCMEVRMATHFIISIGWQKNKKLIDECWDLY